MWVGAQAGRPLDNIFTGAGTIAFVSAVFGGWVGSMIGGSGWSDTISSFHQWSGSKIVASLAAVLTVIAGACVVLKIADSATFISGFLVGVVIMTYLLARETKYRFMFVALLLGAFIGAAISAAGGNAAVERVAQILHQSGFDWLIESGHSGALRHRYLGRDREDLFIGTVLLGYLFVTVVKMIAFIGLELLGISIIVFDRRTSQKKKRG